ncbi:MAG: glycosyltransferase [Vitreoscilla sp.]
MSFLNDYESTLAQIKTRFVARQQCATLAEAGVPGADALRLRVRQLARQHDEQVAQLRRLVRAEFARFDAGAVSSLVGFPAQSLTPEESVLHRIWIGGPPPAAVREAIRQWGIALELTRAAVGRRYRSMLWAWDARQFAGDACFERRAGAGAYVIGRYRLDETIVDVGSLALLLHDFAAGHAALLAELHAKGYYVNLSDIARQLVLKVFGGIYMDADTIPSRTATIFLARPEVPDYLGAPGHRACGRSRPHVSWLNAFDDENGFLVSRKDNSALDQIIVETGLMLAALRGAVPARDRRSPQAAEFAARLHGATYGAWRMHLGHSLLAYDEVARLHCVLQGDGPERRPIGLHGMRLVVDWLTQRSVPLSAAELASRARCVAALARRGWQLDAQTRLEDVAQVCWADETPRLAYAPQLRTAEGNLHYYSFLSRDEALDRVNTLFGHWLIARNAQAMRDPAWWARVKGGADPERTPRAAATADADSLGVTP